MGIHKNKLIGFDTETLEEKGKQIPYSWQIYSKEFYLKENNYNCYGFYSEKFQDLKHLFSYKTRGFTFICANAQFDISVIAKTIKSIGLKIKMHYAGAKFISAEITNENEKIHGDRWYIIDILNVFTKSSVEKLGKVINLPKLERPEYLGKRPPTNEEKQYFVKYAIRDAEICYHVSKMLVDEFDSIRATLPSLTMANFQKYNDKHGNALRHWKQPYKYTHQRVKESYHGARTESFCRGTLEEEIFAYDVRSLYPSIMVKENFPNVMIKPKRVLDLNLDFEGVANCTITQDTQLPPICTIKEFKDVGKRLIFPNGKFTGWFTYPELRYIEEKGYGKIQKVITAYEWMESFKPFKGYISNLFKKRNEYLKQNSNKEKIYKLMMNALYGKFGQNLDATTYEFDGESMKKIKTESSYSKNTHFIIASYITAFGRIKLHELMNFNKGYDILYCDTDGFLSTKKNFPTKDVLGGLTDRNLGIKITKSLFIRPKAYILNDAVTFKGLPLRIHANVIREKLVNNKLSFTYLKMLNPREASIMKLPPLFKYPRTITFNCNADLKRHYFKRLDPARLLSNFTESEPIKVRS